jgi:hypothetical protein
MGWAQVIDVQMELAEERAKKDAHEQCRKVPIILLLPLPAYIIIQTTIAITNTKAIMV